MILIDLVCEETLLIRKPRPEQDSKPENNGPNKLNRYEYARIGRQKNEKTSSNAEHDYPGTDSSGEPVSGRLGNRPEMVPRRCSNFQVHPRSRKRIRRIGT